MRRVLAAMLGFALMAATAPPVVAAPAPAVVEKQRPAPVFSEAAKKAAIDAEVAEIAKQLKRVKRCNDQLDRMRRIVPNVPVYGVTWGSDDVYLEATTVYRRCKDGGKAWKKIDGTIYMYNILGGSSMTCDWVLQRFHKVKFNMYYYDQRGKFFDPKTVVLPCSGDTMEIRSVLYGGAVPRLYKGARAYGEYRIVMRRFQDFSGTLGNEFLDNDVRAR